MLHKGYKKVYVFDGSHFLVVLSKFQTRAIILRVELKRRTCSLYTKYIILLVVCAFSFILIKPSRGFLFCCFTVPPPNRAYLRTLIHNGDLEHLEKVVLDGHGAKLMHETSALDKVSKFIYALPDFMVSVLDKIFLIST